ncbi:MAG: FHA domain-containing protein [Deltaproteobacteria bacterium]|nr:FHA domain-containing protein [Deltaproteobacteria bacterium]
MPSLLVISGPLQDQVFDLGSKEIFFCGRSPKMNDIAILEISVSRKHFKIFRIGRDFFIEDLNSKHGTLVNGEPISPGEGFQINEGDLISVGNTVMKLVDVGGRGSLIKPAPSPEHISGEILSENEPRKERRSAKELELVYNVSELLKTQMDINAFFTLFLNLLLETLPRIDNASVFLVQAADAKGKMVEIVADSHEKTSSRYKKEILKRVANEKKTIRMSNTDFELPQSYIEKGDTLEIKSAMGVPIISGNELLGAIYIESIKPYGFRKKDQFLLNSLVGPIAVAIEKNRLNGKLIPEKPVPFREKLLNIFKKF